MTESSLKKIKAFFSERKKMLSLASGLILFLCCLLANPFGLLLKANLVLSIAILMISWWILDAMPMAAVALLPIVLFPLFNISSIKEVTKSYSDSIIFLFMGGFFIGIGVEKWNLHKRIALGIIRITGTNGNKIILGFIIATGFLSMWLSNTATTMMMFPIAASVIHVISKHQSENANIKNFSLVLMLSIAYASNFALGTIIGTPPNVAYANYIAEKFNYTLGFANWMLVFTPLTILLLLMLYWVLVKILYPNHIKHSERGKKFIDSSYKELGSISTPEIRVLIIFSCVIVCWIFKDLINHWQKFIELDDTIIAMAGALAMFIIPSGRKTDDEERLLHWHDTKNMAWGILLLFGGGLALAKALEEVKIMDQLGRLIAAYSTDNVFIMMLAVTTLSVFLSEVMSNVAQVIVMAPVISSVALALHIDPLLLGIPMTLGASCASMLPMGTPPNAIVFASGHIKMKEMIKAGFIMNIISIILITLFCYFLQPLIMQLAP
jgi:sodium-dependent dicarboxylate transporter 2/3/5